jgi:alanyl-tRNA synthetase
MTRRINYTDASRLSFAATVVRALEHEGHPAAVLDRTAFYPTSGGQPFDTGRLGEAQVIDVIELVDGDIRHVLSTHLSADTAVHGEVDEARRWDHM